MRFVFFALMFVATGTALYFGLTAPLIAPKHKIYQTSAGQVAVEQMAGPFSHPWAVAFLPDGVMLVTERVGRLWRVDTDGARTEVAGVPVVRAEGQGGLLDVVAARDFVESREIFMTFSEPVDGASRTAVAVARLNEDGHRLENLRIIFRQRPASGSTVHYGSRIVEAPDGTLWVTLGERGLDIQAQNLTSHLGKVVRIFREGSAPRDNPYVSGIGLKELWSIGHRNPQGAALDAATGKLWTVEHGAKGGDEVNQPEAGKNYGWPVISYAPYMPGPRSAEDQRMREWNSRSTTGIHRSHRRG